MEDNKDQRLMELLGKININLSQIAGHLKVIAEVAKREPAPLTPPPPQEKD